MTENLVTAADLAELIVEFETYRDRLVSETTEAAKKAKKISTCTSSGILNW